MTDFCMNIMASIEGGLRTADYVVVAVYLVSMLGLGCYFAREQKSGDNYFLAGRSMGWFPLAISLVATLVSTTSFLSYPSETYGNDIRIVLYIVGIPPALYIVQKVFIPFYQNLQVTSAYEYLEKRFHVSLRSIVSALFILMRLVWMAVATHTASLAVMSMTGMSKEHLPYVVLCVGLMATFYTAVGGIKAVIWTDVVQFFVFFGALVGTCIYVLWKLDGGLGEVLHTCAEAGKFDIFHGEFFTPDPRSRITFWWIALGTFTWVLASYGADQLVVQRFLCARDIRQATRSLWGNFLFGDILLTTFQIGVGLCLFTFYQKFRQLLPAGIEPDNVFPHFIAYQLPVGFSGLVLAALCAAIMSSVDSGVNSITAVATVDFYRRFSREPISNHQEVMFAKILTLVIGTVTCVLAAFVVGETGGTILERIGRASGFLVGPILGVFILGAFSRRANTIGTSVGAFMGILAGIVVAFGHRWDWFPELSFLLSSPASALVTILVGRLACMFWPRPQDSCLRGLVYQKSLVHISVADQPSKESVPSRRSRV